MAFISYAQNFEDVMLWRALGHVPNGTYIDIGACDPVVDSVTQLFYSNGWSGVNVEPVDYWHQRLCQDRARDVNLNVAISTTSGTIVLYEIEGTGLTTSSHDLSKKHQVESGFSSKEIVVHTKTLDEVISEFSLSTVHFLKIDVEGAEADVLKSINLKNVRPWIILVESTEPNTQVPSHDQWENLILYADYQFAYFDGLNRFYVANEHPELLYAFMCPPNYFDNFITRAHAHYQESFRNAEQLIQSIKMDAESMRAEFSAAKSELAATRSELATTKSELATTKSELATTRSELDAMNRSLSWRYTAPLRRASQLLKKIMDW